MDLNPASLFSLAGKAALVTGATRGIGRATAEALGLAGARVVVSSNEPEACAEVAAALCAKGIEAIGLVCDVTQRGELEDLAARAEAHFGGVDVLVCNAGAAPHFGPIASADESAYEATMAVNLKHPLWLTGLLAPKMAARGGGAIVLTSSISGVRGNKSIGLYALSKAALAQLARNLAVEWGPPGVRVNSVAPGLIRTNFASGILDNEEALARRLQLTPLRRVGEAWEIAAAIVFLASPGGGFISGHNLIIDGGTIISDGN
jgi:NAD(P)-dependent dehydrogenase (short-subunit alcohol dehydrogenase family)